MTRFLPLFFAALIAALPSLSRAGSSEAGKPVLPAGQVAAFSGKVQSFLAERGAHVAIVARTGRDPRDLPDGVNYTHVAYWVYSQITHPDGRTGRGYRVYNLYQMSGDETRSSLVQDSPDEFFAGAHRLSAGIVIPDIRLQKKLAKVIASPTYKALHNPNYSVLANPQTRRFQNCTEHTLDVLMAALYGTGDVRQIKADITAHFEPQHIQLGGLKRMLAPVAARALTTADHGAQVKTATFGSIARFMLENDLAEGAYHMTSAGARTFRN